MSKAASTQKESGKRQVAINPANQRSGNRPGSPERTNGKNIKEEEE